MQTDKTIPNNKPDSDLKLLEPSGSVQACIGIYFFLKVMMMMIIIIIILIIIIINLFLG